MKVSEIATKYHNLLCNLDHTDQCGWGYGHETEIAHWENIAKRFQSAGFTFEDVEKQLQICKLIHSIARTQYN